MEGFLRQSDENINSRLVGYADKVSALMAGRNVEQAQHGLVILLRMNNRWTRGNSLSLALSKMDGTVLLVKYYLKQIL